MTDRHATFFRITIATMCAIVLVCMLHMPVFAQTPPSPEKDQDNRAKVLGELMMIKNKMENCAKMREDRAQRLRCYDGISEILGYIDAGYNQEREELLGRFGFWNVINRESAVGETTTYLKLDSSNAITNAAGFSKNPTLILRCKNKKTDVYIDWASPMGNTKGPDRKIYLSFRFDGQENQSQEWEYSLDYFSAFSPTPTDFVREMRGKQKLIFEITPYEQSAVKLLYELKGFDDALNVLIGRCYNQQ